MKTFFLKIILFFLLVNFSKSFITKNFISNTNNYIKKKNTPLIYNNNLLKKKLHMGTYSKEKTNKLFEFGKMIRISNNFFPALVLNFFGGYIMNPSLNSLVTNYSFIYTCIITQLVMYGSMILNDIFDINVDRVNNPSRPLVKEIINIYEAIGSSILFYLLAMIINYYKIKGFSKIIGFVSIFFSILYTPVFKKILFVKNLICSLIVSNTILYSGLLFYSESNPNISLLINVIKIIFVSSLYIEILQDIKDYVGDKINKIYTIPVVFNKKNSIKLIFTIIISVILNITSNSLKNSSSNNLLLILPFFPMIKNLFLVYNNSYSQKTIKKALIDTSYSQIFLFLIVLMIIKK